MHSKHSVESGYDYICATVISNLPLVCFDIHVYRGTYIHTYVCTIKIQMQHDTMGMLMH